MTEHRSRETAEWFTFGIALALVLAVVALLLAQLLNGEEPAAPVARQDGPAWEASGKHFVPVAVSNEGDVTAADVQVVAELTIDGEVTDGEQTIDFLAGDETDEVVFSFDDDPAEGELVIRVGSYSKP